MGISDFIKSLFQKEQANLFQWQVNKFDEIVFSFDKRYQNKKIETVKNNPLFGAQLAYLSALKDEYEIIEMPNGFVLPAGIVPNLDADFAHLFALPSQFQGKFIADIRNNLESENFALTLQILLPNGEKVSLYQLEGCFLKLAENERYTLSPTQYQALQAVKNHQNSAKHDEYENSWLIFQLQLAKKGGANIDLKHFEKLEMVSPEKIGVAVEVMPNGDIQLIPAFPDVDIDDIRTRTGQITKSQTCLLRVKNKFVIFDDKKLEAMKDVLQNTRIKKEQVAKFLDNPTAYLDSALIDLDTGFSLRVFGAEHFIHRYFGEVEKSGIDWFSGGGEIELPQALVRIIKDLAELEDARQKIKNAQDLGATLVEINGVQIDISDEDEVERILDGIDKTLKSDDSPYPKPIEEDEPIAKPESAVIGIKDNDEYVTFATTLKEKLNTEQHFDLGNLKRLPFEHQKEGINWLLAHFESQAELNKPSGALLADDMGLGKTYMTLVAIAEKYHRDQAQNKTKKPVLIVAPLSLLENWQAEINETFKQSPFNDVVVLQSDGDLSRFKVGKGNETKQQFAGEETLSIEQIRFALKVGKEYGDERLDMPQRLVLTTYQTLRDYQFSMSVIDWAVVAFDEAQNLKNPNAIVSRAARGLKADFKLLTTGTPVENSLKDFWSLMDIAVPGLLGAWKIFRETYIAPILKESDNTDIKITIGKQLREKVDDYMLRRTKAEKLKGLPEKITYSGDQNDPQFIPSLGAMMVDSQLAAYDNIIKGLRYADVEDKRELILSSLRNLKVTSIHYQLELAKIKDIAKEALHSAKLATVLALLDEIKQRQEKVLIFAETKKIQAYLKMLLLARYGLECEIINGDTQAVATKKSDRSRKKLIDEFQAKSGFNVMIMSPIAAGVGLTVVGANNVIHLERHWNPAKEAQATDRVYRIGQQKTVNVYLPMALHPKVKSFDLLLNQLLGNKVDLSNAVVANPELKPDDFMEILD